jgi:predicted MPP superfamily phosphohydrolase
VLEEIAAMRPDWIFVTGDLLNVPEGLPHLFRFLANLRAVAQVYLTLGNHDHSSGVPVGHFLELADRHKLHLLMNQVVFVPVPSGELCIVGVDDPSTHRADVRCIPTAETGRFTVLLAHAPNILDALEEHHATDLILCGHSHGGQWRFKRIRPFWLPYGCRGRASGFYAADRHRLYVNRGLGWAILPIRLNCPPEITVIDWVEGPTEFVPALRAHDSARFDPNRPS